MTDVFISYKREDRARAKAVAEYIVSLGYSVWWDIELLPGEKFAEEINAVLSKTKAVVVLWTPEATKSDWVLSEASIGLKRDILIPAKLQETNIPVPYNIVHTLDLSGWNGNANDSSLSAFEQALKNTIGEIELQVKRSTSEVQEELVKPEHEVEFWNSIALSATPSIREYELYLEKYGELGSFSNLAVARIAVLQKPVSKVPTLKEVLTVLSVLMGILVGGFTIANMLGYFGSDSSRVGKQPDKIILEKFPKVIATTISTWENGSHTENCVPPLASRAGYVLIGGELGPAIGHPERVRAGCPPPGHCNGHAEFCSTVIRSEACYVNKDWFEWKETELSKVAGEISFQTMCN